MIYSILKILVQFYKPFSPQSSTLPTELPCTDTTAQNKWLFPTVDWGHTEQIQLIQKWDIYNFLHFVN